jgi:tetratricopeptide (TPR) repeat protein
MTLSRIVSALTIVAICSTAASLSVQANELQDIQNLLKQGNQAQALDRANAYLVTHPKDAQVRFLKGVALTEQNKTAEAIKVFTALTEDFPELPEPYNNLAVLYASQQQYDKARQALEMAIQTHPSYATAHENLGDIYAKMASVAYDRALKLDKSNAAAQTKLSLIKDIFPINSRQQRVIAKPGTTPVTKPTVIAAAPAAPAVAPAPAPTPIPTPIPTPAKAPEKPVEKVEKPKQDPSQAITDTVNSWAQAWSNQNVSSYLSHYAADFKTPKGEPRGEWEKFRKERVSAPKRIKVSVSALKISVKDDTHAQVTFRQHYNADTLSTTATKTLVLIKSGDKWLIQQERVGS